MTAKALGIDKIGAWYDGKILEDVIYRLQSTPLATPKFPYVVVSDKIDSIESVDLVTVSSFPGAKGALKRKVRKGLGVEFLVTRARKQSGEGVAKWLASLSDAYAFCESTGCQFILSSGATCPAEMISGRSLDEILAEIGIEYRKYWQDLNNWLNDTISRKVVLQ